MQKNAMWKWMLLIVLCGLSVWVMYPPMDKVDEEGKVIRQGKIRLGLDLKGGSSFVVEVDRQELQRKIEERDPSHSPAQVEAILNREVVNARDVGIEAIRNRIDNLGIAEPAIYPQLDNRIVIQMPGVDEKKREEARKSIQSVAFLEFRLVHKNSARWVERLFSDGKFPKGFKPAMSGESYVFVRDASDLAEEDMDAAYWQALRRFAPHEGAEFMLEKRQAADQSFVYHPYFVETVQQLTGKSIKTAMSDTDNLGRPKVSLEFDKAGRRKFAQVTRDYAPHGDKNRESNDGRQLAIILDGTLRSAPELREEINTGRAEITGSFSLGEVRQLVNVLRTGALQAPMRIVEERTVSATLGRDSIKSGVNATLIGSVLVMFFMGLYYLVPGLLANTALILDLVLLPLAALFVANFFGVFSGFQGGTIGLPTLTLPGIAGIALTLGMAVDANVLINERIREELKAGKHLGPAVEAGYDRAFLTIFDSNLTTLLAAVIMFWQGTGPVRGYAITLSAGILASMYTAVVVTRMIFDWMLRNPNLKTVRMLSVIGETRFDFLKQRYWAIALSVIVIVGSWTVFVMKGQKNFNVEFVGGAQLTCEFKQKPDIGAVRTALETAGIRDASPQYQGFGGKEVLVVGVPFEAGEKAKDALEKSFADAGCQVIAREEVGPQIGDELKRKGIVAVLWSLVGMIVYISVRFEFSFAVGAVVALVHDVLVAVGVFCLLGRQLSTPMIAVVLTIIGYSVNDTVVIFDRIREQMKLHRDMKFKELCNTALNQTLGRTILTSGVTLLSVISLMVFGGGAINDFAVLLFIGFLAGVYSTIFIATPVALLWHPDRPKKEVEKKTARNGVRPPVKGQPAKA